MRYRWIEAAGFEAASFFFCNPDRPLYLDAIDGSADRFAARSTCPVEAGSADRTPALGGYARPAAGLARAGAEVLTPRFATLAADIAAGWSAHGSENLAARSLPSGGAIAASSSDPIR